VALLGIAAVVSALDDAHAETEPGRGAEPVTRECDTYVVRPGDTIWGIARARGMWPEQVYALNDIEDPRALRVGLELCLPPSGEAPEPRVRGEREASEADAEPQDAVPDQPADAAPTSRPELRRPNMEARLEASLAAAETQFYAADFEAAAVTLEDTRGRLELLAPGATGLRARVELLMGMVHVAFGRYEEARASFRGAIRLDPDLTLDAQTSPKIVSLFEEARSSPDAFGSGER
jgi:LysM repeat protein